MSTETKLIFVCSFCNKPISFSHEKMLARGKCPSCGSIVRLLDNQKVDMTNALSSEWWVRVPKKIIFSETQGPITEIEFVGMFEAGQLNDRCEIRSEKFTGDQWIIFDASLMQQVVEETRQKKAEMSRIATLQKRRDEIRKENKQRIQGFIKQAVADGDLTSSELRQIESFAIKAKLDFAEVKGMMTEESEQLIEQMLESALDDGVIAPDEEDRIKVFAMGLGVSITTTNRGETGLRMMLARLAYQLSVLENDELKVIDAPFALQSKEQCLAQCSLSWFEVVTIRGNSKYTLGEGRYLKFLADGDCYLTTKRVFFESSFESKKVQNDSIQRVEVCRDGIFLNRSTGKSIFLMFKCENDSEGLRFGLKMRRFFSNGPVQGFLPEICFIPDQEIVAELVHSGKRNSNAALFASENPRFTFRVVGEHIGDRSYWIFNLNPMDEVRLLREPSNPVDRNAVIVLNSTGKQLGYLKAEVAAWFSKLLDRGHVFSARALRILNDGGLVIAVYEI